MTITNIHILKAELESAKQLMNKISSTAMIERLSLSSRIETLEGLIRSFVEPIRKPAKVRLTFRGRPVCESRGIFADFGMNAVGSFSEAVATMAASLSGPLAYTGPIPNKATNQLLITNTAVGSFGFELEEYQPVAPILDEPSLVETALEQTVTLLKGAHGSDDDLADAIADIDPRATASVRNFLQAVADAGATFTLVVNENPIRFADTGEIVTALERISVDRIREEKTTLEGEFQGVLPKRRTFEFKIRNVEEVIAGKVSSHIQNPDEINKMLHQQLRINVLLTQVGNGRPRYTLIDLPSQESLLTE